MRPFSFPSDSVFDATFARGDATAALSGDAFLQAMLDFEAALARACARQGLCPPDAAKAIARACESGRYSLSSLAREGGEHATPVVGLVAALRSQVGPEAGRYVHLGATSQDTIDTATMLLASRALVPVLASAHACADACAELADRHRRTPMVGRTLLQQAQPTSFGLRAAGWMTGLDEAAAELRLAGERTLSVQLGGAVGTQAAFDGNGPALVADLAEQLGLAAPTLPWHANRVRPARFASAAGILSGAIAKIGRDVVLLAQGEVGEVREGGAGRRGASTAMAHKRNPVAAISTLACAGRIPGLIATVTASMDQEHERAAGGWQAQWQAIPEALRLLGSESAWALDLVANLEVDAARMAANLEAAPGDASLPLSTCVEAAATLVAAALADRGRDL